jgi:hypothetical protein
MTMHLDQRLSMINNKKRKTKMTKARHNELVEQFKAHNKRCKQTNQRSNMYASIEDYIDYCYGRIKIDTSNSRESLVFPKDTHRQTPNYPSMMEESIKNGTFHKIGAGGTKKEPLRYTGERKLLGIATMHKSNAVPIFADDKQHAIDIARMRR